ncbi:acyltransferase family protein [Serinibacter salmoneus]|uniref:Peptidoglycan-N-acetylmuramate O-acetyltransferase n=1 Tax=Serinibacter salmoneus TaxID=556530 RepID=A0A2A9D2K3_9MICO|nr:acyltransferase family protein [Serinibacter salmoneus]PFG20172.1 peptidoglycan-N-acetylmuramate O-acetyltransferase [Serinibacter salmoneus]
MTSLSSRPGSRTAGGPPSDVSAPGVLPRPDSDSVRPHAGAPHLQGLDGLRALAVLAVFGYHAEILGLTGGFLGVDLFFVISGYLITTLILVEVTRTGRFAVGTFYLRRARRLLPALYLVLAAVAAAQLLLREQLDHLRGAIPAAIAYVSNWFQILASQSYFDASERPSLLRHLWTLAVEMQFYLVAPLLAWVALRWGRRTLGKALLITAGVSAVLMVLISFASGVPGTDPTRVYVGTDTHLFPIVLGAAAACVWRPWLHTGERARRSARTSDVVAVVALAAFLLLAFLVQDSSRALYLGGYAAIALVCLALVTTVVHPGSAVGRILERQPLRWIGTRSYGIYLWHWPVLMLTRPGIDVFWPLPAVIAVQLLATGLLAEASWRYVETPIRRGALGRWWTAVRTSGALAPAARGTTIAVASATVLGVALAAGLALTPDRATALESNERLAAGSGVVTAAAAPGGPTAQPGQEQASPAEAAGEAESTASARPSPEPSPEPTAEPSPEPTVERSPEASTESAQEPAEQLGTVSVVGDSVAGIAAPELIERGVASVDWEVGRQFADVVNAVFASRDAGTLGHTVVVHGGTNGPIGERDLRRLIEGLPDRRVFLVTVRSPIVYEAEDNERLAQIVPEYGNAHLIDWFALSDAHPEWFYEDHFHPREGTGTDQYADLIWEAIQP